MTALPRVLALLLLLVGGWALAAIGPAGLARTADTPHETGLDLLAVLEDSSGKLGLAEVLALPPERWQPLAGQVLSFGESASVWWVRATLTNPDPSALRWILEVDWPHLDWLDVYIVAGGRVLETVRTGDQRPFASRPLDTLTFAIPLEIGAGETREIFLRLTTNNGLFAPVPLRLWVSKDFWSTVQRDNLWAGLYFGILLALLFHNLLLFQTTRDRNFVLYALYLGLLTLWGAGFLGYGFQFLWPNGVWWQNQASILRAALVCLTSTLFVMHFLETRRRMPALHGLLLILSGLVAGTMAVEVVGWFGLAVPTAKTSRVYGGLATLLYLVYLAAGMRALWLGVYKARYFVLAWSFPLLGVLIFSARNLADLMHQHPLAAHAFGFGTVLECLLLALALGDHYRWLRDDKLALEQRWHAEQAAYAARLEHEVAARTRELSAAVAQLDVALQVERRARDEQQAFLATVSHELRTPLAVIDTTLQNLARDAIKTADERTRRRYDRVLDASRRLSSLLTDQLDEGRFSLAGYALRPVSCDPAELLRDAAEAGRLMARGHRLQVEAADPREPLVCDPNLTRLALRSLADNAVKYTPPGTGVILRSQRTPDEVWLEVEDQGPGLDPDELIRIFEPHVRGRGSRAIPGSGMGLPLARRMIERQGGTLTATSVPGQGSVFRIALPATGSRPVEIGAEAVAEPVHGFER
ncbi:MAG: sensor histidine kinase [Candidatus Contendobacter sp.]|nr:sensor histidine kinase [Candidatus Contendobacter sp.]